MSRIVNANAANAMLEFSRQPVPCKICHRPSLYTYYRVRCCEGCKQFFRRVVVNKKEYSCTLDADGICIMKRNGKRCLGCRLERCLLAGMQPRMVNLEPANGEWYQFIQRLEERRQRLLAERGSEEAAEPELPHYEMENALVDEDESEPILTPNRYNNPMKQECVGANHGHQQQQQLENCCMPLSINTAASIEPLLSSMQEWHQLNMLLLCEERQRPIWEAWTELPAWIFELDTLDELIQFPGSLFIGPKCQKRTLHALQMKMLMAYSYENADRNFICIDALLLLEWTRALPMFAELEAADRLSLLKHIGMPFTALCNAFYATLMNADTWTRGNGHTFHRPVYFGALWEHDRLRFLSKQFFCAGVEAVQKLQINREEFALLLGIICCNSTPSELSATARDRLYNQSADYCRTLLRFLQIRHGPEAGARKFADCMHLMELMFCMQQRKEMLFNFCGIFSSLIERCPVKVFPKALSMFNPF